MEPDLGILNNLGTIIASGFMAYLGVRVALAEIKGEIKSLKDGQQGHGERITWLERQGFARRKDED